MVILIPFFAVAVTMAVFVVIEGRLRQDASSRTLKSTGHDKGTTRLVGIAFGASWIILALSVPADFLAIGSLVPGLLFNCAGILLMLCGLAIRAIAARTLGRYYSRTLRVKDDHRVVSEGIYRLVRHPGYLGVILMFLGAALAVANFIALALIALLIISAYMKRMAVEERMLMSTLGTEYAQYVGRTRRLIPFLY
ncbi:MAG TPA: isoprenylcysteine carboxylmethyltransferase family protein [Spirochaetia bacterium]|nr:isoprenylcysteine carboxylmethyltransferase family protein [Spirochaetia bacterium]